MDLRKIKKLMELLEESGLAEIEVKEGEESIKLSRTGSAKSTQKDRYVSENVFQPNKPIESPRDNIGDTSSNEKTINSPMIGTFYRAASPESKVFVEEGQKVKAGEKMAEWDPYTVPIITEKDGKAVYGDLTENVSVSEEVDEATGLSSKVVMDWRQNPKGGSLKPRIMLEGKDGKVLTLSNGMAANYFMSVGAILSVENGADVKAGDEVKTGSPLISLEVSSGSVAKPEIDKKDDAPVEKVETQPSVVEEKNNIVVEEMSSDKMFASPGVRRLARELEIELSGVKATGLKGRITKEDLHGYIKQKMSQSGLVNVPPQPKIDFSKWGNIETKPLTKIQKITGERLQQAWQTIPHVTQFNEADISVLNQKRKELKKEGEKKSIKVTFLPFIIKAVIKTLKEFPRFNSSLDHLSENLVLKNYYNIGIAVDTPTGLVVPVIKNADNKSILGLSKELMDISERARSGKLKPDELRGGCFTISSLGGIGGTNFTPIINPPEVAILGVSKSSWKPIYDHINKEIVPTFIMPYSLSYDHRVIDGAIGAAFTTSFSKSLLDVSTFE